MYLSRSLHPNELLNILGNSKQARTSLKSLLKRSSSRASRLAAVDLSVLERVENEWKRALFSVKHYSDAIFVLGPMGAGKTTAIENCFKTHAVFRHYAYVDTDEIMGSIDAFAADKVDQYYPLARKIAIRLTDWILGEKISFVAEGTCVKYDELIEYMERLKESGYKIHVSRLPLVPLDVILRRSKHRKNRIISDEVVTSIYEKSYHGLKKLFEYNKKVGYTLFEDLDCTENSVKNHHKRIVKPLCAT